MKIKPDSRLFWFFKEDVELDLDEPSHLDMYVQQVWTRGHASDVRDLLKTVEIDRLKIVLNRIRRFIPTEVRSFWEDFLGSH